MSIFKKYKELEEICEHHEMRIRALINKTYVLEKRVYQIESSTGSQNANDLYKDAMEAIKRYSDMGYYDNLAGTSKRNDYNLGFNAGYAASNRTMIKKLKKFIEEEEL